MKKCWLFVLAFALISCGGGAQFRPPTNAPSNARHITSSYAIAHAFQGPPSDGWAPAGGLVANSAGLLFGTTIYGGTAHSSNCQNGCGTAFRFDPASSQETILYSFTGSPNDGSGPSAPLLAYGGAYYGTTEFGGSKNFGTVFELTRPAKGGSWRERVLYNFQGPPDDGSIPGGLTVDAAGNLYGSTWMGGSASSCFFSTDGCGTVFELARPASGHRGWTESVLHSFTGAPDGAGPRGTLVRASDGAFYGVTAYGGRSTACPYLFGCGTVFQLTPHNGSRWSESVVHHFNVIGGRPRVDGSIPSGSLVQGADGRLYGATSFGGGLPGCDVEKGLNSCGTLFVLTHEPKRWVGSILYAFKGSPDGAQPDDITPDGKGGYYGETSNGGGGGCSSSSNPGCGTIYEIDPPARLEARWTETILHSFNGKPNDGLAPGGPLAIENGTLYGATLYGGSGPCELLACGTIYQLRP